MASPSSVDPTSSSRRPVVGFLVDHIDDSYQNELLRGLAAAAREQDVTLFAFCGGALLYPEHTRNSVYELPGPDNIDALIFSAATLENRIGSEALAEFVARFHPLPRCTLGVALPGVPSVLVDNAAGMHEVVSHLITAHQRQHIAFIQGPEGNEEAAQRYRGYLKALLDHKHSPEQVLVTQGDFLEPSGARAVRTLLDERQVPFDAVVAANDHMALGAMRELVGRQIAVPDSVAVAGFDDLADARYASHPLTTVRQPLAEQARQAMLAVLEQLEQRLASERRVLTSHLITRRSCGCGLQPGAWNVQVPARPRKHEPESPLIDKRGPILQRMLEVAPALGPAGWGQRLLDGFIDQLRKKPVSFVRRLDEMLNDPRMSRVDPHTLQRMLSSLRTEAVPALANYPGMLLRAETMLHEARLLLTTAVEHREAQKRLRAEASERVLSETAQALITTLDLESLQDVLSQRMPALGLPSCFLSTYTEEAPAPSSEVRLIVALNAQGSLLIDDEPYPAMRLIPTQLAPSHGGHSFVVQSLYFQHRLLGLLVFEMGPVEGTIYETLRAQISAALEGILLVEQLARGAEERQQLLRRIIQHGQVVRDIYYSLGDAPASEASKDTEARTTLRRAVDELGMLISECIELAGDEMETLRPTSPDDPIRPRQPTLPDEPSQELEDAWRSEPPTQIETTDDSPAARKPSPDEREPDA